MTVKKVKVVVAGSYREQEQRKYDFWPGQKERFERTARAIGRKLAEQKYILVIAWSQDNPASQFDTRSTGQPNHPWRQTADYHALEGYLEAVRESQGLIAEGAKIELIISGRRDTSIPCQPFGKQLEEYLKMYEVDVDVNIPHEFPYKRSEMLKKLASEAHVFIVIGGGKATEHAMREATRRQILLPLGFAGGIGQQAIAELSDDFKQKLNIDLATRDVDTIIAQIPTLINLITSKNTSPNLTSGTNMTTPPNKGNNEPSAPSPEPQPPNDWGSFLRTIPHWLWVLIVGGIIFLLYTGKVIITGPGGIGVKPPEGNTEPPSDTGKDDVNQPNSPTPPISDQNIVTVNYQCTWEGSGVTGDHVQLAEILVKSQNGNVIPTSPTRTDRIGRVSFQMEEDDEVSISVRHDERSQFIDMSNIKLSDIEKLQLEKRGNTVSRTDCILTKK